MWKICLVLAAGVVLGSLMTHLYQALKGERSEPHQEQPMEPDKEKPLVQRREHPREPVRILCLIPSSPKQNRDLQPIKDTWGKRCDVLLFMSTQDNQSIPTIALPVREGWKYLWGKMKASLGYVYERHLQEVDWVLKADDDTYVVMENLRHLLSDFNSTDAVYFGYRLRQGTVSWMSGGAGYVMSREAVRRLVEEGECRVGDEDPEDFLVSECLESVGVRAVDSRDALGRDRFIPHHIANYLNITYGRDHWYPKYTKYSKGFLCCSEFFITFHYVDPLDMYLLEFLIYNLTLSGVSAARVHPRCNTTVVPSRENNNSTALNNNNNNNTLLTQLSLTPNTTTTSS